MLAYLPKSYIRTLILSVDNLQGFPLEVTSSTTRCTDGDSEEQGENQHNDWKGYIKMFLIFLSVGARRKSQDKKFIQVKVLEHFPAKQTKGSVKLTIYRYGFTSDFQVLHFVT